MSQSYKVFINNSFIEIVDQYKYDSNFDYIESYSDLLNYLNVRKYTLKKNVLYVCEDPLKSLYLLKSHFYFISAAGGIVKNKNNQILCIKKNNIWDFPKGKLEKNESASVGAIREVIEETNVKNLKIISKFFSTYHLYKENRNSSIKLAEWVLKETQWFLMKTNSNKLLIPQLEEGITDVQWIDIECLKKIKTYASIKYLIRDIF